MKEISKKKRTKTIISIAVVGIIVVGLIYLHQWIQEINSTSGGWGGLILAVLIGVWIRICMVLMLVALPFMLYAKKTDNKKMWRTAIAIPMILAVLIAIGLVTEMIPLELAATLLGL